jgi:hypothetical protein
MLKVHKFCAKYLAGLFKAKYLENRRSDRGDDVTIVSATVELTGLVSFMGNRRSI